MDCVFPMGGANTEKRPQGTSGRPLRIAPLGGSTDEPPRYGLPPAAARVRSPTGSRAQPGVFALALALAAAAGAFVRRFLAGAGAPLSRTAATLASSAAIRSGTAAGAA